MDTAPTTNDTEETPPDPRLDQLVDAARDGDIEKMRSLLAEGVDPNGQNKDGFTALCAATSRNQLQAAKFLVEQGADILQPTKYDVTSYDIALYWGHIELVQWNLENGISPFKKDHQERTPLNTAVRQGHPALVRLLLEKGADINEVDSDDHAPLATVLQDAWQEMKMREDGVDPTHTVAPEIRMEIVRILIEEGAALDTPNQVGYTALMYAAAANYTEAMQLLIESGARTDLQGNDSMTVIDVKQAPEMKKALREAIAAKMAKAEAATAENITTAVIMGDVGMLQHLLRHGTQEIDARINKDLQTPLMLAITRDNTDMVKALLDAGADLHLKNTHGETAIAQARIPEVRDILLGAGAVPVIKNLMDAVEKDDFAGLEAMLRLKTVPVDDMSTVSTTLLNRAAYLGRTSMVQALMAAGAGVREKNSLGNMPLHSAASCGHADIVAYLLDHGAPIDEPGFTGSSPLQEAVSRGKIEAVEILLARGADMEMKDEKGNTALMIAVERDRADIAQCLIEHGAEVPEELIESAKKDAMKDALRTGVTARAQRLEDAFNAAAHKTAARRQEVLRGQSRKLTLRAPAPPQ